MPAARQSLPALPASVLLDRSRPVDPTATLPAAAAGIISFTEFAAAVMPRLYYLNETNILDVFGVLDVDRDGVISLADLTHLVGEAAFAEATLAESDLDGDGVISFADFVAVLVGNEQHIL